MERLGLWQQKALREAKLRTSWAAPNEAYESLAANFLTGLLRPNGLFLPIVQSFVDLIAPAGAVNGLAQTLLKLTVPGMPDFFQGTEFWDLSLVDPDNRRAVDYDSRRRALATGADPLQRLRPWRDGRVKQALIRSLLGLRRRAPALFARGGYVPVPVVGEMRDHVVAFARHLGESAIVVTVPRLVHRLLAEDGSILIDPLNLRGSSLSLPQPLVGHRFSSLLTNGRPVAVGAELPLDQVLTDFPMSVLHAVDSA
jgi:(1->4)-alpha-D-glucan 1-alpha-D-glucosylmutase